MRCRLCGAEYTLHHDCESPRLRERIAELEADAKLNAQMLARQNDLAREAETRVAELENQLYAEEYNHREALQQERERTALRLKVLEEQVRQLTDPLVRQKMIEPGPSILIGDSKRIAELDKKQGR